jgi:dolichol kinase
MLGLGNRPIFYSIFYEGFVRAVYRFIKKRVLLSAGNLSATSSATRAKLRRRLHHILGIFCCCSVYRKHFRGAWISSFLRSRVFIAALWLGRFLRILWRVRDLHLRLGSASKPTALIMTRFSTVVLCGLEGDSSSRTCSSKFATCLVTTLLLTDRRSLLYLW